MSFAELLKKQGKDTIKQLLGNSTSSITADKEVLAVIHEFAKLDKECDNAKNQPYEFYRTMAKETVEKYAMAIGKEKALMTKMQITAPELHRRIIAILEQELEIDL